MVNGGTLGAASNALTIGSGAFLTSVAGNLVVNSNTMVGSISSSTLTTSGAAVAVNTVSIAAGMTLLDTGAYTQGIPSVDGTNVSNTSMTISGAGTLNISPTNNANFQLGGIGVSNTNANSNATLTMTTLGNFIYNTGATGTGNFNVGFGIKTISRLILAANSTITAATLTVGDSNGGNNGGTSNMTLGTGTNIINVANVVIGNGKESGSFNFPTATTATLLLTGQAGGSSTANITVGTANGGSGASTSSFLLAGHSATVQANNVIVGNLAGASNGAGNGTFTFDTGAFTAANFQLAVASSGGDTSAGGPNGNLTIGGAAPNTTATGVFNVTNSFFLANNTLGTSTSTTSTITAKGNMTINGGTVNIGSNIQVAGQANTTLALAGGTLNMEGFQINGLPATGQINNVNLPSGVQAATLQNLGGTGINGAGLTSGAGTLTLEGSNTYTGATVINGTVNVGTGGTTGTLGVGAVTVNGTLNFNRSAVYATSDNVSGAGVINQVGTGAIVLAGTNTSTGALNISNGTVVATGSFGPVTMASGGLHAGTTASDGSIGTLTLASLTTTGGDLRFDLGPTSDLINVTGAASFMGTTLSVDTAGALTAGNVTLITSGGLTGLPTLTTTSIGRTNLSLGASGNNVVLTVSGGAAALKWNGINGTTWNSNDVGGGIANFKNGAAQDVFFSGDSVTFDDSNTGSTAVTISGTVQPSSVAFANSAQDYTVSGGSIGGSTGLSKSGTGNVTLANVNTYSGGTNITGGNLTIASGGSIASTVITVGSGASLTVASGGDISVQPALTDNGVVTFNNPTRTLANLAGSGTVNLNGTALTLAGGGTFAGAIQGTGSLNVSGGTVVLTGTSGYSGGTSISGGALQLGAGGATGSVSGPISSGASGVLAINLSGANITNAISGSGGVTVTSPGTQFLTGTLNYSGLSTISGPTLEIAGANTDSIGGTAGTGALVVGDGSTATALTITGPGNATGTVTVNAGSTLAIASAGSIVSNSGVTLNGGTLVAGNNNAVSNLGSATLTIAPAGGTLQNTATSVNNGFNNPIALNGNLTVDFHDNGVTGRNFTYSGNGNVAGGGITGSGNLLITNSGTLGLDTFILSNANPNLSGKIFVGGGTSAAVRLEVTDALADANILGTGSVNVASGSQLWFNQAAAGTFNNTFNIAGTGSAQDTPPLGAMRLQTGNNIAGTINLTADASISIGTVVSSTATLSGQITGAHTLTLKNGIFTLNNAGTPSSYGPGTAGSAATIIGPSATAVVSTAGSLSAGGLQLAGGALNLNGLNVSVNNLSSTLPGQTVGISGNTGLDDTVTAGQTNFVIASTLSNVNAGDSVSGAGLPSNSIILSTATSETPSFNGTVGSPTVTITTLAGLTGLQVNDPVTGLGIPAGTTITAIAGQTLTLSNNVTAILSNGTASVSNVTTGNVVVLSNTVNSNVTGASLTILDGSVVSNNGPSAATGVNTLTVGADNSNTSFSGLLADGTSGRTLAFAKVGSGTQTLTGANTYSGGTSVSAGTLVVGHTQALGTGGVAIHTGGKIQLQSGLATAVVVPSLTFDGSTNNWSGTLDLSNDKLIVEATVSKATALANLQNQAHSALTSSTMAANYGIAVLDNAVLNRTTFGGVNVDANSIMVSPEILGDANADGHVDLTDLSTILNNFGATTSAWTSGNFDGAATIDLTDLSDVLNNFGLSNPNAFTSGPGVGGVAPAIGTPEPGSLAVLGMGAVALIRRRRKA